MLFRIWAEIYNPKNDLMHKRTKQFVRRTTFGAELYGTIGRISCYAELGVLLVPASGFPFWENQHIRWAARKAILKFCDLLE